MSSSDALGVSRAGGLKRSPQAVHCTGRQALTPGHASRGYAEARLHPTSFANKAVLQSLHQIVQHNKRLLQNGILDS